MILAILGTAALINFGTVAVDSYSLVERQMGCGCRGGRQSGGHCSSLWWKLTDDTASVGVCWKRHLRLSWRGPRPACLIPSGRCGCSGGCRVRLWRTFTREWGTCLSVSGY